MDPLSIKAFNLGIISAVSLPLGAFLARFWTPRPKMTALLMAFGGGALLAALTIDLVAESVNKGHFVPLFIGCISGGVLYEILNQVVNNKGGFLRKPSTTMNHLKILRKRHYNTVFRKLSHITFFRELKNEEIHELIEVIKSMHVKKGHPVIKQGGPADAFYIIIKGSADVYADNTKIKTMEKEEIFGEVELIKEEAHPVSAIAVKDMHVFYIKRHDFLRLIHKFPHFAEEVKKFVLLNKEEIKSKQMLLNYQSFLPKSQLPVLLK